MDVSRSMCSTDIPPNRLEAARAAALAFIHRQEPATQIGVVAFAGFAALVQSPTTDQAALEAAVNSLTTGRRTAIGSGILQAIAAIAEVDENIAPITTDPASSFQPNPLPPGAFAPAIIVLLTDGVSNAGPQPLDAAQQAVDRGLRVYTIGFGTDQESVPDCLMLYPGSGFGNNQFGNGGGFGGGFRRGIDEETLKQVAELTGGEYYSAESASELQTVFEHLPTTLTTRPETREISVVFAGLGVILSILAIFLSLLWRPLP